MVRFTQRLAPDDHELVRTLAARNERSVAAEIRAAVHAHVRPPANRPLSDRQRAAFYAKCRDLDEMRGLKRGASKLEALAAAAAEFGRAVESVTGLSGLEAGWALDWLERALLAA